MMVKFFQVICFSHRFKPRSKL